LIGRVFTEETTACLEYSVGEWSVAARVENLVGETGARDGQGEEPTPERGFMGKGIDTNRETRHTRNLIARETTDQVRDHFRAVAAGRA
jgi:hypothetical protein